jgi:hypothetical protein
MHSLSTFGAKTNHGQTRIHKIPHNLDLGGSHHPPLDSILCRNPTLAKCEGEAQHLEKVRIWSTLGLPNVQSSTARPKTPRIEVFLVSLERS